MFFVKAFLGARFNYIIYGSSHPASIGDLNNPESDCMAHLTQLKHQGIRTIISLDHTDSASMGQIWASFGDAFEHVTHQHNSSFFIEDFQAPTVQTLDLIVNRLMISIELEHKTDVHCRGGLGRTGTVLAGLYMKVEGASAEQAIECVRQHYHPKAIETTAQTRCLKEYEVWLKTR